MESRQPAAYTLLLALTIVLTILAVITLIPNAGASKPNVLGYKSLCTFAPAASLLCGLLAAITCTVRNRLVKKDSTRSRSLIFPLAVAVVLLGGVAASTVAYAQAQMRFGEVISATGVQGISVGGIADGIRTATAAEGDVTAVVEVTVKDGRISALKLAGGRNIEPSVADAIFSRVQASQKTDVDSVSGATASSQVLLMAIETALKDNR